jgi:hypothetical protein
MYFGFARDDQALQTQVTLFLWLNRRLGSRKIE